MGSLKSMHQQIVRTFDYGGIACKNNVSFDQDEFSEKFLYGESEFTVTVRKTGALRYQYTVSAQLLKRGICVRGNISPKEEWKLEQVHMNEMMDVIKYSAYPSKRMYDGINSAFYSKGYNINEYCALENGFTARIQCLRRDGWKGVNISIRVAGSGPYTYSYVLSETGLRDVSGSFSNTVQWELNGDNAAQILAGLKVILPLVAPSPNSEKKNECYDNMRRDLNSNQLELSEFRDNSEFFTCQVVLNSHAYELKVEHVGDRNFEVSIQLGKEKRIFEQFRPEYHWVISEYEMRFIVAGLKKIERELKEKSKDSPVIFSKPVEVNKALLDLIERVLSLVNESQLSSPKAADSNANGELLDFIRQIVSLAEKTRSKMNGQADPRPEAKIVQAAFESAMEILQPLINQVKGLDSEGKGHVAGVSNYDDLCGKVVQMVKLMAIQALVFTDVEQRERFICAMSGHIMFLLGDGIKSFLLAHNDLILALRSLKCKEKYIGQVLQTSDMFQTKKNVVDLTIEWK